MIPRSFANGTGEISLPRSDTWKSSGILLTICRDPSMRNFVLSGFIRRLLAQHHIAILRKSAVRRALTSSASLTKNDRYSFESSTYDSREHISGIEGRSYHLCISQIMLDRGWNPAEHHVLSSGFLKIGILNERTEFDLSSSSETSQLIHSTYLSAK